MFKTLEISNLRGINNLKIDDFSRINVFVGPNNSGKTTILEALFLMVGMSNPELFLNINAFRQLLHSENNDFRLNFRDLDYNNKILLKSFIKSSGQRSLEISPIFTKGLTKRLKQKEIKTSVLSSDEFDTSGVSDGYSNVEAIGLNFDFKQSKQKFHSYLTLENNLISRSIDKRYKEPLNARFFSSNNLYSALPDRIDQIQKSKKKNDLIKALSKIEPKIIDIALSKSNVVYIDIGIDQLVPINLMGYGFTKACSLISNLLIMQDGHLMIDEIENGLHHETLAILWNAIITAATEYNVQIFITTHSYEALKILLSVVETNDYDKNDIRLFLIQKLKEDMHKCYKYDFESLEANVNSEVDFRGKQLG